MSAQAGLGNNADVRFSVGIAHPGWECPAIRRRDVSDPSPPPSEVTMHNSSLRRGIRATALAFLALAATLAGEGCGKDGGSGPTDPLPSDPGPSDPGPGDPSLAPAPVGRVVYAVDLANNFLVFGTESFDVLSQKMRITGLPILKRIIGIAIRPSNGKLYGVGNDSRMYTIDPSTAVATPVGGGQFSPKIVDFFEIHFAMALEPNGDRVRLISTEAGTNWSISLDDGTAVMGAPVHYAAGDPNEGVTPHITALIYRPSSPNAALNASISRLASSSDPCTEVMYMIDPDLAAYIGSCDGDSGDLGTLGPIEESWARCMETLTDPDGGVVPSADNPYGMGGSYVTAMRGIDEVNSWGTINPDGSLTWHGFTQGKAIQTAAIAPGGTSGPSKLAARAHRQHELQLSVAGNSESKEQSPPPPSDPRAQCGASAK
jgi:hypothetical protein